ncbi:hypothetical protein [Nonlabens xiamenensis]|uniref:hypothetical protein n=1 Tax=Nonlabens xiamenensis TaxID=2341043 RepID=UPI000F609A56|nr:hypothetical protein [Nonlabens xiamenensis]
MKNLILITLFTIVGCASSNFRNDQGSFTLENQSYIFTDNDVRNVQITFVNDSLIRVTNRVSGLQAKNYDRYNFINDYRVSRVDVFRYRIGSIVDESDRLSEQDYVLPYRKGSFIDRSDIFPSIENDTLFFNQNFGRVQLKEFSFDIRK